MHDDINCAVAEKPRASALDLAEAIDFDLSNLEQAISDLTDSLIPILHDAPSVDAPGDYPSDGAESALLIRLRNRQYRLRELTDRIYALRARLEV